MRLYTEFDKAWLSYSCVMTRSDEPSPELSAFLAYLGSEQAFRNVQEPMTRNVLDPRVRNGLPRIEGDSYGDERAESLRS